jgi:hypothetical protein
MSLAEDGVSHHTVIELAPALALTFSGTSGGLNSRKYVKRFNKNNT